MASLFEERALLDLVRGLKTLRGGCETEKEDRNKSDNSFGEEKIQLCICADFIIILLFCIDKTVRSVFNIEAVNV